MRPTGTHRASQQIGATAFADMEATLLGMYGLRSRRYVDGSVGASGAGTAWSDAFKTIQEAVNASIGGDRILIAPGDYNETVTIARNTERSKKNLQFVGVYSRDAVAIAPLTASADGLVCHEDGVLFDNIDIACPDANGKVFDGTGSRLTFLNCKLENGLRCVSWGPGTVAQVTAVSRGKGGDLKFYACEFAWGVNGIVFVGTDYGAATQVEVAGGLFHNLSASSFEEVTGSGGSAGVHFRNLAVRGATFDAMEDGTIPTKFFSLDDDNANTGIVTDCAFPVAINSGKNLVSTKLLWSSNRHTGGISTAQPS